MFEVIMTIITLVIWFKLDQKNVQKRMRDKNWRREDMFGNPY